MRPEQGLKPAHSSQLCTPCHARPCGKPNAKEKKTEPPGPSAASSAVLVPTAPDWCWYSRSGQSSWALRSTTPPLSTVRGPSTTTRTRPSQRYGDPVVRPRVTSASPGPRTTSASPSPRTTSASSPSPSPIASPRTASASPRTSRARAGTRPRTRTPCASAGPIATPSPVPC